MHVGDDVEMTHLGGNQRREFWMHSVQNVVKVSSKRIALFVRCGDLACRDQGKVCVQRPAHQGMHVAYL